MGHRKQTIGAIIIIVIGRYGPQHSWSSYASTLVGMPALDDVVAHHGSADSTALKGDGSAFLLQPHRDGDASLFGRVTHDDHLAHHNHHHQSSRFSAFGKGFWGAFALAFGVAFGVALACGVLFLLLGQERLSRLLGSLLIL